MKNLVRVLLTKFYTGKNMRGVITAAIMVYTMLMIILIPTFSAYAEASNQGLPKASAGESSNVLAEESAILEDISDAQDIYEAEDKYKNTWENNYNTKAQVSSEDISKRQVSEKQFLMSDGSYTLTSYSNDIHYYKDGKIVQFAVKTSDDNRKFVTKFVYKEIKVELPEYSEEKIIE